MDILQRIVSKQITASGFNFQYGNTYLTASKVQALGYATSKGCSSELLGTAFEAISLLERSIEHEEVKESLENREDDYPHIYNMRFIHPIQMLITIDNLNESSLLTEDGEPPGPLIEHINNIDSSPEMRAVKLLGRCFRLIAPIPVKDLQISFINVYKADQGFAEHSLYEVPQDDKFHTFFEAPIWHP